MRVLNILPGVTPDAGTERSFLATAPGLIEHGVELHLALLTARQSLVPELERLGVVVHDLSSHHHVIARVRAIRRVITAISPDLIHASLFEATLPAQLASLGTDVPVLISWVNTNYGEERFVEPGSSRWKLAAYQTIETIAGTMSHSRYHAVTAGVGRFNSSALHVHPGRVMVAERGRDPQVFSQANPSDDHSDRFRPGDHVISGPMILAVGRQEPQKGYETLLTAFDELADHRPDAHLVIAGRSGLATRTLSPIHAAMRHGDQVTFLGQRDDVAELMAIADIVVCSSWREGAAGALIESMACGTPVVSVPLAGTEGILVDGVNAVVVERTHLAEGMERVLSDPEFAQRLADAGRQTFEERFTIDAATERMLKIYDVVVSSA